MADPVARSWWEAIEKHVVAREAESPDPWADSDVGTPETALTDDQAAFLAGLSDQPPPSRLAGPGGVETGNSPGDEDESPRVPSP